MVLLKCINGERICIYFVVQLSNICMHIMNRNVGVKLKQEAYECISELGSHDFQKGSAASHRRKSSIFIVLHLENFYFFELEFQQ